MSQVRHRGALIGQGPCFVWIPLQVSPPCSLQSNLSSRGQCQRKPSAATAVRFCALHHTTPLRICSVLPRSVARRIDGNSGGAQAGVPDTVSALAPRGGCLLGDGLQAAAALLLSSPLSPSLLRERRSLARERRHRIRVCFAELALLICLSPASTTPRLPGAHTRHSLPRSSLHL